MRHIIPISGKDSLMTAIIQRELESQEYEYAYHVLGAETPEIFDWLKKVESYLGAPIIHLGRNLEQVIYGEGILPSPRRRFCTRLAKIQPMNKFIGKDDATLYLGIRADEPERGIQPGKNDKTIYKYPLRENGITLPLIWAALEKIDLLPPSFFWERLYKAVIGILGSDDFGDLLPWEFNALFAGRSRPNCSYCFFMRKYELIWILEAHPDLFWKGAEIEKNAGTDNCYFREDWPYARIYEFREQIFNKRVNQVLGMIAQKRQGVLFPIEPSDELSVVSCGIFCGK